MKADKTEFETKVLDINVKAIIKKLRELGAKETPELLARRFVFDLESENMEWIRLRDNGGKITVAYKYKVIGNTKVGKTIEIEVEVSDFDKTAQILSKIPFKRVLYQENKSHIFNLNGIEFSIDHWPMLKPYLEVESTSQQKIEEGLKLLGLERKDIGDVDIVQLYKPSGINPNSYPELKF